MAVRQWHTRLRACVKAKGRHTNFTQTELEGTHDSAYLRQVLAFNAEKFRGCSEISCNVK